MVPAEKDSQRTIALSLPIMTADGDVRRWLVGASAERSFGILQLRQGRFWEIAPTMFFGSMSSSLRTVACLSRARNECIYCDEDSVGVGGTIDGVTF